MDRPFANPQDPRVREQARALFGDKADVLLQLAERLQPSRPAATDPAPRDAGKFVRQLAALYSEDSAKGAGARDLVASIIRDALALVNLLAQANPEG